MVKVIFLELRILRTYFFRSSIVPRKIEGYGSIEVLRWTVNCVGFKNPVDRPPVELKIYEIESVTE